jgi:hypothetical protein
LDYTICRAPRLSNELNDTGAIAAREGEKPANRVLSRNAAAKYFLDILENNIHIRETVSLSNR